MRARSCFLTFISHLVVAGQNLRLAPQASGGQRLFEPPGWKSFNPLAPVALLQISLVPLRLSPLICKDIMRVNPVGIDNYVFAAGVPFRFYFHYIWLAI